ncbi:hypothetical protein HN51_015969, partial [Arachis hypogaea]
MLCLASFGALLASGGDVGQLLSLLALLLRRAQSLPRVVLISVLLDDNGKLQGNSGDGVTVPRLQRLPSLHRPPVTVTMTISKA